MRYEPWILPALLLLPIAACRDEDPADDSPRVRGAGESRRVLLERILISYRGNPLDVKARRSREDAKALAHRILERARAGEDFVQLRNGYSDDRSEGAETANGPYVLLNYDVDIAPTLPRTPRMERMGMGRRFGDRAFRMQPGDIALVEYHEKDHPVGYEVLLCVKRDDRDDKTVESDLQRPRDPGNSLTNPK